MLRRRARPRRDRRRLAPLRPQVAAGAAAVARSSRRSSTSTSSTTPSSTGRPSRSRSRSCAFVERPLIAGSITRGHARLPPRLGRARPRPERPRPLATRSCSRAGIAVLAVVFIASRDDRLAHHDPDLPADRRRARRLARAAAAPLGRLARDARLAGRGRRLDRVACSASTSTTASLQLDQQHSWFSSLGVSYYVGQFGFSLWLVGLTVVCGAVACGYAWWAGRERPRAYFGLLLFLTGSVVGVFCAQDLLLFYAFFEAMLIPLYVLIGVWGGAGRLGATIKFVVYTVAGSLLMLAAIIVYGLQQGTFDLTKMGHEHERLALPRLRDRVRGQGAALPVPRLAARRLPRVVARGGRPALGRDLEGGRVRLPADRDREVPRAGATTSRR